MQVRSCHKKETCLPSGWWHPPALHEATQELDMAFFQQRFHEASALCGLRALVTGWSLVQNLFFCVHFVNPLWCCEVASLLSVLFPRRSSAYP